MSIDFTGVKAVTIPEGEVKKITRKSDGAVLWEKVSATLITFTIDGESYHALSGMTWGDWLYGYQWENFPDLDIGWEEDNNKVGNSVGDHLYYQNGSTNQPVYTYDAIIANGTYVFVWDM